MVMESAWAFATMRRRAVISVKSRFEEEDTPIEGRFRVWV